MSERTISPEEKEDLIKTFEEVLNDFEVVAKSDVESLVEERMAAIRKSDEAAIQDPEIAEEEVHTYGPDDLQQILPDDVWEVVRQYLATDGTNLPDESDVDGDDVEKAVNSALTTSGETLRRVRGELAAHQEASTSYEGTEKSISTSDMLLSRFYDSVEEPGPIRKADKTTPAGLTAIEEADV